MSNKSENYISSLLTAIDTVVNERLSQIAYDKTIICTILDDSDAKNGNYFVSDGSVKFWAQSENTRYLAGDQVRVTVLNGDMTKEKFIIGRYNTENDVLPITYVSPLDTVLKISDNLVKGSSSENKVFGLSANGDTTSQLIWELTFSDEHQALQQNNIYDTIFLQADFKTLLSNYNIVSGNYGLVLQLHTADTIIDCTFDASQMFGNPYAFSIYTTQAVKFNISDIGNLTGLKLFFRQDRQFQERLYTSNRYIDVQYDTEGQPINNLLVKNLTVGFGSDVANIPSKTVRLFTADPLTYSDDTSLSATKRLNFVWYNKDDNNRYIGFTDGATNADGSLKLIDENQYLEDIADNARLKARMSYDIPLDEQGLRLAADMKDAYSTTLELSDFLGKDLAFLLGDFRDRLPSALHGEINTFINQYCGAQLTSIASSLSNVSQMSYDFYTQWLHNAAARLNPPFIPTIDAEWTFKGDKTATLPAQIPDYHAIINNFLNDIYTNLTPAGQGLLTYIKDYINNNAQEYIGVYDLYEPRITDMLGRKIIRVYWSKLTSYYNNSIDRLQAFFVPTYVVIPWEEQIIADDNAYSISLWQYDATAPGNLMSGPGWNQLDIDIASFIEHGVSVTLDPTSKTSETFQVIIFFNHEKFVSNTITFTNASEILNLKNEALTDTITIEHGANSLNIYQLYGTSNVLTNSADKYRQRELTVSYIKADGTVDKNKLNNTQIYWYLPVTNTMLTYDPGDLGSFTEYDTTEGTFKSGYKCFYKKVTNLNTDLRFIYRIKEYYCQSAANNTIYCKVVNSDGIEYINFLFLNFAAFGTSGTDHTLILRPMTRQAAITDDNTRRQPYYLQLELYNYDNELVSLPAKIELRELLHSNTGCAVDQTTGQIEVWIDDSNVPTYGAILEASIEYKINNKNTILKTYYALPYARSASCYAEGASTVIYNSQGENPSFYKGEYVLYGHNLPVMWQCKYYNETTKSLEDNITDILTSSYLPKLSNNVLSPATMYVENGDRICIDTNMDYWNQYYSCVLATDGIGIVWCQPIFICQNRYSSAMLNAWDGELTINESENSILASMVGAGRKNNRNEFEGVLMGEIKTESAIETGLYGYHKGGQSFGFLTNGTAFIGPAGFGRIRFDGTKGEICSETYENPGLGQNPYGMHLNIKDGILQVQNQLDVTKKRTAIRLAQSNPYFEIKVTQPNSDTPVSLIHVDDEQYYLQTLNYVPQSMGTKLDLGNGLLDSYKFSLNSKNIIMNSGQENVNYFEVKHFYTVDGGAEESTSVLTFGPQVAQIQSRNAATGLKIDLDAGSIDAKGDFSLTAGETIVISNKDTLLQVGNVLKLDQTTTGENGAIIGDLYLQSTNYNDGRDGNAAAGMKLDLARGELKAYSGLTIKAFDGADESFIISTDGDPWLSISNVIFMSPSEQWIQTNDYVEGSAGMQIDLINNSIKAYGGFTLNTDNIKISTTGDPWLNVNDLIVFDINNQYIKSQSEDLVLDFKESAITIKDTLDLVCGDDYTTEYFAIHTEPNTEESYINFEISDENDENRSAVLRIASNEVVFASPDFYWDDNEPKNNKGIQLSYNHEDGSQLLAANFTLRGVGIEQGKQKSAFRISNDSDGYMRFWTSTTPAGESAGSGTILFELSEDAYALRTPGFGPQSTTGFEIDLANGSITAKSGFHLSAKNSKQQTVNITTAEADFPLNIDNAFTVDWDGSVAITKGSFIIGEKVVNGVRSCTFGITEDGEFGSNITFKNDGSIDHTLSAFSVDTNGYVHACQNGVQINSTGLHMRQGSISIKDQQGEVVFSVTSSGSVEINNGSIKLNHDEDVGAYLTQLTSQHLIFGYTEVDSGWVPTFKITPTQVAFGPNDDGGYNFTVNNSGTVTITGGNLNMTSGSIILGQYYNATKRVYQGAFKVTSAGELYMGYTTNSDASTVTAYKTYIDDDGIAHFVAGNMESCTMDSCTMDNCVISGSLSVENTGDVVSLLSSKITLGTSSSTVNIKGSLSIAGNNTISGSTYIGGSTTIDDHVSITGTLDVSSNTTIGGTLTMKDNNGGLHTCADSFEMLVDTPWSTNEGSYVKFIKGILVLCDTGSKSYLQKKYPDAFKKE